MFKILNHKSVAFKLSLLIVFSALFYVQLQVKFIESAYNDYTKAAYSANHTHHSSIKIQSNRPKDGSETNYVKLNKRFPVYNVFTLLAAPLIVKPVRSPVFVQFFYKEPFIADNTCPVFFLRGPPVMPQHSSL